MDIVSWDQNLLVNLNAHHSPFFDGLMWLATDEISWLAFFAFLLYAIYKNKPREFFLILIAISLTVLVCDQVSGLFKDWIARPRPSREPDIMSQLHIVNDYRGGKFGFFSSHAANTFGIAVLVSLIMRNKMLSLVLFLWAAFESYTRIYLGVHYPLDIITGIVFGSMVGYGIYILERKIADRWRLLRSDKLQVKDIQGVVMAFLITIFMLLVASKGITDFLL